MNSINENPVTRDQWKGKPIELRLTALENMYIDHEASRRIVKHVARELICNAARNKATGALIVAPPGGGKTVLIDHLKTIYPDVVSKTLTIVKVVSFKIPKSPTPKALSTALLKAQGDPLYDTGSAEEKMERSKKLLKTACTLIVAMDDFQDIPARRRAKGIEAVGDWVRDLCEADFPGVVLAFGTEAAAVVRDSNPQLLRRMQARLEMPLFSFDNDMEITRFKGLMKEIDNRLPLAESSGLEKGKTVARIHIATNGNLDYIVKLIAKAMIRAVSRGSERIEMEDLRQGFEDQHQVTATFGNPFDEKFSDTALNMKNQVFHVASSNDDAVDGETGASAPTKKKRAKSS